MNTSLTFLLKNIKDITETTAVIRDTLEDIIELESEKYQKLAIDFYSKAEYKTLFDIFSHAIVDLPMIYIFRLQRAEIAIELEDYRSAEKDINIFMNRSSDESLIEVAKTLKEIIIEKAPLSKY